MSVVSFKVTMPTTQAQTFDDLRMPWTYDADVGPIVASPVAGRGDGKFIYAADSEHPHTLFIQLNPSPTSEEEFARRRHESLKRVMQLVEQQRTFVDDECNSDSSEDEFICNSPLNTPPQPIKKPSLKRNRDSDDQALVSAGFRIEQRSRPNGGRIDLTIVAPDGKRFRSKSSAYTYMTETCDVRDQFRKV